MLEWMSKLNEKLMGQGLFGWQWKYGKRFGDSGGGVEQVSNWTPGQSALFDQITASLGQQWGQSVPGYQGQLTPAISELQQAGFRGMGNLTPGTDYFQNVLGYSDPQAASRMMGGAEQAMGQSMQPFNQDQFRQQMQPMADFAGQQFNDYTVPAIMERYAGANAADSGAAQRALGRAGNDMSLGLSAQMAPYLYQGNEAALNRQQQGGQALAGMSMIPGQNLSQAAGLSSGLSQALLGAGGQQRQIAGEQLGEQGQKWQQAQAYNNPWLQYLSTALNSQPFDSFYGQGTDYNAMAMQTGGQLGSAAIIASALSDRRMKKDIEPITNALEKVERLDGKIFQFLFRDTKDAGVIAQDVEAVLPEAVEERNGIKFIKLDAVIGLLVNAVKELATEMRVRSAR